MKLGTLQRVDIRKTWPKEPEFSEWLSQDENLAILGEALEIELCDARTEVAVGEFSADIIAQEDGGTRIVLIENQYGSTNHDYLGKLLTYAAGRNVAVLVWIVENAREEHRAAVQYLNEHTSEDFALFLVKIELWKIGNSDPAPKFTVLERPNDWTRSIQKERPLTDLKQAQGKWWSDFQSYLLSHNISQTLRPQKPRPQHWYTFAIGSTKGHLSACITHRNLLSVELYIPDSKETFQAIHAHKEEIEHTLGFSVEWQQLEDKKAARVRLSQKLSCNDFQEASLEEQRRAFEWYCEKLLAFRTAFRPYFK